MTLHALWAAPGPAKIQNSLFRLLSIHSKGTPLPQEQWGRPQGPGREGCEASIGSQLWECLSGGKSRCWGVLAREILWDFGILHPWAPHSILQ